METVYFEGPVLWSQIDANMHLRHSAYGDFATQARLRMLNELGFDYHVLLAEKLGPVLFREELIYLREVGINETLKVTCALSKMKRDGSRWSFTQNIYRGDGVKAAIVNTDGAWIDTEKRKLTVLPEKMFGKFSFIPKTETFIEEE